MRLLPLLTLTLISAASAAPFLGTKASFVTSAFCKAHTCKHVATVPSGHLDQFHYDVAGKYRVVVWRYPTDAKRLWGPEAAPVAGKVQGVGVIFYGVQDTPFGAQNFVGQLMTFATGKSTPASTALKWLDAAGTANAGWPWATFHIANESSILPGANAAILSLTAVVDPYR